MSLVLDSRSDAPMLVRATLAAVGKQLELEPELLEDLKLAVTAACNNVVVHAYGGASGPLAVHLGVRADGVDVLVSDEGSGIEQVTPAGERARFGLAVISALADCVEFHTVPGEGTEVRMSFGKCSSTPAATAEPAASTHVDVSGDPVITLSPVQLLGSVLPHLIVLLAGRARFSLHRCAELAVVTAEIAAHAEGVASGSRICLGLLVEEEGRMDVEIAPLRTGASTGLQLDEAAPADSPLVRLIDELTIARANEHECLHVVLRDR